MPSGNCGRLLPMTDEDKSHELIRSLYRGLPQEGSSPELDAAVLSAARASVVPRSRRNWAVPASLAAVLVLSVAVTVRMEGERPDVATMQRPTPSPQSQPPKPPEPIQPTERKESSAPRPSQAGPAA